MVTVVIGAVAVGLVSICAIPLGCLISRRMKTKVRNQRSVGRESSEHEMLEALMESSRRPESQPGYVVEEFLSKSCNERVQRFEVRVFISNGSATGSVEFDGRGENPSQDAAAGPAAGRRIESAASTSAPVVPIGATNDHQTSIVGSETTRLEITISGPPPRSTARFVEFKNGLKDATSTPKKRRASWNSWNPWNHQPTKKVSTTSRDIETSDLEPAASKNRMNSSQGNRSCRAEPTAGPSTEGGEVRARGKRAFPYRFLETLKESTSIATLTL